MKRMLLSSIVGMILLGGCTSYYKVTDPTTGKSYYTTEVKQRSNGSATLKDARTGSTVNVQNSEVQTIKKEEFESGKNTEPTAAAPAPPKAGV
jgi:uncharacterized protein YceK